MKINIRAIEKYLPQNRVPSEMMDLMVGGQAGRIEKNTGVQFRHHASHGESVCQMGAFALTAALKKGGLKPSDLDLLIYAGASFDYPVPHNSVIIKSLITDDSDQFNCLDVDTTCLSFLSALDIAHLYMMAGRHNRIAIVCSELASIALSPKDEKVFGLFGDAAVAVIIESSERAGYVPMYTSFSNYPSGSMLAHVGIGGAANRGRQTTAEDAGYFFAMDGKNLIRQTTRRLDAFIEQMEKEVGLHLDDFDKIITHQTSRYGNEYFLRHYGLPQTKVVETLSVYGNCISASIPLGLEYLLRSGFDTENSHILILGSGAGLTIGAMVLKFG